MDEKRKRWIESNEGREKKRRTYLVVAVVPKPNESVGADDVVVCAPYGGALRPNVSPLAVVAVVAAEAGAAPIDAGAVLPKPNDAAGCCCCVAAVCCVFETPNAKPVLAGVVCGAPNEKDIF